MIKITEKVAACRRKMSVWCVIIATIKKGKLMNNKELETLWQVFKDTTWSKMSVATDTIQLSNPKEGK
jgi:hypothetical protein